MVSAERARASAGEADAGAADHEAIRDVASVARRLTAGLPVAS
jgi:hypothetical protein